MVRRSWHTLSIGLVLLAGAACGGGSRAGVSPQEGGAGGGGGTTGDGGLSKGDSASSDSGPTTDAGSPSDGGAMGAGGAGGVGGTSDAGTDAAGGATLTACQPDVSTRVPPAPLRRLSNFEYANTLRDVLGFATSNPFPPAGDVSDDVSTLTALTDGYHRVAHDFASGATANIANLGAYGTCDVVASGETTCAERFVASFVPRLFRRPLEPDDATEFADVFAKGRELGGNYESGLRAVIEVAMQSPEFLYRVEFGQAVDPQRPALGRPSPYEMATRLSYLFLASAPDKALTGAAAADELKTSEQLETQARRLLADARAHDVTRDFYTRLFRIGDEVANSNAIGTNTAAAEETTRFLDDVVWVEGGDLETLLGASFSFVNPLLAQTYGIAGITGSDFQRAALPPAQRRGILTQASLLGSPSPSGARDTHPSARGALIFEALLCGDLPPTPSGDQHMPAGARGTTETARQWLQRATASAASCQSCHQAIDPLGLAFEHYTSSGAWRDGDEGMAIDASGTLVGVDTAGSFDGAIELIDRLVRSRDVRSCHVRKWMESAYGRPLIAADACSRAQAEQGFERTGGNIRELLIGLTQTEAFLYRPAP